MQRQWGFWKIFCFINLVDIANWPPQSFQIRRFEREPFVRANVQNVNFKNSLRWPIYNLNSVDKNQSNVCALICGGGGGRETRFTFTSSSSFTPTTEDTCTLPAHAFFPSPLLTADTTRLFFHSPNTLPRHKIHFHCRFSPRERILVRRILIK